MIDTRTSKEVPQPKRVKEWRNVSPHEFACEIVPRNEPAVIRGAANDWPMVRHFKEGPQALVEYLIGFDTGELVTTAIADPSEKGRLVYKDGAKALNHRHSTELLPNVLKGLVKMIDSPSPHGVWIGGLSAPDQLPGLQEDNPSPLMPAGTRANLWIGNAVTVPPHFDAADNLGFVAAGRRRFTLFPPEQVSNLYVGPFDLTPSGVPVSMPAHDAPDLDRYPRFREALANAQVADVEAGDAIYIPYLWWHGVQSLGRFNLLVNYWWYSDAIAAAHPYGALLRASYELFRNMPQPHREAWRHMYDHWVFGKDGDPMGHLPQAQRDIPPTLDPQAIGTFKRLLGDLLHGGESMEWRTQEDSNL